ncbi:hypothetical protein [Pseudoalteromonas luteoviolacea]|uniref:5-methyltetrahydrofolate--homocysteine methyltransferase n=1 Tax=Pseudoalteromonas luteoviolacea NCIMB 1942 TaxID=1365253 RepID=A0A167GY87_9GAMM|nr:hypothetical protein [Pseudoalteromonas luteoviolacea]KZN57436.1 hypothetical protein N482_23635 [Pseudoalteromonas luteoviolacea NCIMB 1942]
MKHTYKLLSVAVATALLTACGDTKTTIIEHEPVVEEVKKDEGNDHNHDNDHDHGTVSSEGRLLVTSTDSNSIHILDLEHKEVAGELASTNFPKYVYTTENSRYAVLVQSDNSRVEFIDGGIWEEDHGDHMHPYEEAPKLSNVSFDLAKPAHVTNGEHNTAIFFDGEAGSTNAQVAVFSEAYLNGDASKLAEIEYNTNMHGAAQARGEFTLSTIRDADAESVLPDKIGLFHKHDDHFDQEKVFEETCPALHGSAQNHEHISFACGDGVVVITEENGEFTASKIANPESFAEGQRIGTLRGHEDSHQFIGIAGTELVVIDPEHNEIEKVEWTITQGHRIAGGDFNYDGSHAAILDSAGVLTIFEQHTENDEHHWEVAHSVKVHEHELDALPEGASFRLTFSKAENTVFVVDATAKHVLGYDLESAELKVEIELDFTPDSAVWLGIEKGGEHAH